MAQLDVLMNKVQAELGRQGFESQWIVVEWMLNMTRSWRLEYALLLGGDNCNEDGNCTKPCAWVEFGNEAIMRSAVHINIHSWFL